MVTVQSEQNTDSWRILLFASSGSELLVLRRASGICLPVLHIPPQERIAANLNAEAQRLWSVETVCVAPLDIPDPDRTSGHARYHVMEVCKPEELRRIAPNVMDVEALNESASTAVRSKQYRLGSSNNWSPWDAGGTARFVNCTRAIPSP